MRQALHIFKKDVRYLWYEIAITLAMVVMFVSFGWIEFMLPIAWCNLAARVIYAEPLVGDRSFWITRPYSWKSLLTAKVLFILTFVNLPMIMADVIVLYKNGFQAFDNLPGIIWSQVLLTSVFVLPVVVLATITTTLVQLVLTGLVLLVAVIPLWFSGSFPDWHGVDWIRRSVLIATFALAGVIVILRQYKLRRTPMARTLTVAALVLITLETMFFPWDTAFKAQSWFSKLRIDPASVHIALDPARPIEPQKMWPGATSIWIHLPIQITGLLDGVDTRSDAIRLSAEAAGAGSRTGILHWTLFYNGGNKFTLALLLPSSSFERMKSQPVTIHISSYLTLLGNQTATTIPPSHQPITVPGVGRCEVFVEHQTMHCVSAFRDPRDSVLLKPASGNLFLVASPMSYSPYPADLGVGPVYEFVQDLHGQPEIEVVIVSEVPLAHFRKDAEFRDVRLADFAVPPSPPQSQ